MTFKRITLTFVCLMIVLHIIGYFFPTIFTWGFHSYGFLHPAFLIAAIALCIAGILYLKKQENAIAYIAQFMEQRPIPFLTFAMMILACCAFLFQVRVPLLGDSFIIIRNFENTFAGVHPFGAPREPLAMLYFYISTALLRMPHYPEILSAFLIGELILGAGLILTAFFITRTIFTEPKTRFLAFVFLLALPYMELFWGYVEVYSTSLVALSLYILFALLYLRGKISYFFLPTMALLALLVHYLNALLFPSLVYLTYIEYRTKGVKTLLPALGVACSIILIVALSLGEQRTLFLPPPQLTPFLSLFRGDAYQAYSLLSPYHGSDLANLFLLLSPSSIVLIYCGIKNAGKDFFRSSTTMFFMLALAPVMMFLFIAKFDIPMAIDWDVFTPYFYVLAIFGVYCISHIEGGSITVLPILIIVSMFQSAGWFWMNSTTQPNLERAKLFLDRRVISKEGEYQLYFHFTEYYNAIQDTNNLMRFSRQYIASNANEKRAYSNYVSYLTKYRPAFNDSLAAAFERWRDACPEEKDVTVQYTNFLMYSGGLNRSDGHYRKAIELYHRAIELTPQTVGAYNELGMSYSAIGETAQAISWYRKTLALDSTYSAAYVNLANLYDETGHIDSALELYRKASLHDPNNPDIYLNASIAYIRLNDKERAIFFLQQAARLGSTEAQQQLRVYGYRW